MLRKFFRSSTFLYLGLCACDSSTFSLKNKQYFDTDYDSTMVEIDPLAENVLTQKNAKKNTFIFLNQVDSMVANTLNIDIKLPFDQYPTDGNGNPFPEINYQDIAKWNLGFAKQDKIYVMAQEDFGTLKAILLLIKNRKGHFLHLVSTNKNEKLIDKKLILSDVQLYDVVKASTPKFMFPFENKRIVLEYSTNLSINSKITAQDYCAVIYHFENGKIVNLGQSNKATKKHNITYLPKLSYSQSNFTNTTSLSPLDSVQFYNYFYKTGIVKKVKSTQMSFNKTWPNAFWLNTISVDTGKTIKTIYYNNGKTLELYAFTQLANDKPIDYLLLVTEKDWANYNISVRYEKDTLKCFKQKASINVQQLHNSYLNPLTLKFKKNNAASVNKISAVQLEKLRLLFPYQNVKSFDFSKPPLNSINSFAKPLPKDSLLKAMLKVDGNFEPAHCYAFNTNTNKTIDLIFLQRHDPETGTKLILYRYNNEGRFLYNFQIANGFGEAEKWSFSIGKFNNDSVFTAQTLHNFNSKKAFYYDSVASKYLLSRENGISKLSETVYQKQAN